MSINTNGLPTRPFINKKLVDEFVYYPVYCPYVPSPPDHKKYNEEPKVFIQRKAFIQQGVYQNE